MPTSNERELQKILNRDTGKHMLFYIFVIVTVSICVIYAVKPDWQVEYDKMNKHKNEQIRELQKEVIFLDAQLRKYKR
jgi:hypothetical protein